MNCRSLEELKIFLTLSKRFLLIHLLVFVCVYLNSGLREVYFQGHLFSHEYVRVSVKDRLDKKEKSRFNIHITKTILSSTSSRMNMFGYLIRYWLDKKSKYFIFISQTSSFSTSFRMNMSIVQVSNQILVG